MSDKRVIIGVGIILVLLLAGIGYALTQKQTDNPKSENVQDQTGSQSTTQQPTQSQNPEQSNDGAAAGVTITFKDSGFEPQSYSTKKGMLVTVKNESSMDLQFSSDDHPTHKKETELNLNVLAPGESATFTPTRVGTWGFHDHLNSQLTGTLIVTE